MLGLSYYVRRQIGVTRWRKLHRLTALAWLGGIAHSLGEGTDAGQMWFLAMLAIVAIPAPPAARALSGRRSPRAGTPRDPDRPGPGRDGSPERVRAVSARSSPLTRPGDALRRPRAASAPARRRLQPRRVADHEARELAAALRPAGPALGQRDGVEAPAGDVHPRVAGVGVDRDPAARARVRPSSRSRSSPAAS